MASEAVSDDQALHFLATQGYLPLLLADHEGMVEAYTRLFQESSAYFSLPEDSPSKTAFQAPSGAKASDEGYFSISGEKRILTVRTSERCPSELREQVRCTWALTGNFLEEITRSIANSLNLDPEVFTPFSTPCRDLHPSKRTPTLLRMFRYDRPPHGQGEPTINAEQHKDLGILSLVVGHSPGLQVFDTTTNTWIPVEEDTVVPADAKTRSGGLTATLLGGDMLSFLTRGRYQAGAHRVLCAPSQNPDDPYRFSIVFALRPAAAPIYTRNFESDIVGTFAPEQAMEGQSSTLLLQQLTARKWNVNIARDIRDEQQRKLREKAPPPTNLNGQVADEESYAPPPGPPPKGGADTATG
ncbi:MAG: hypothetical protein Q9191_007678 [Dirinaria sp. TL-2023a]